MIEARNLTKRYGSTVAVDALSFDVRPGRVTGFLGPNGSGKSTTMRMILGLDGPDAGEARIGGAPLPRAALAAARGRRAARGQGVPSRPQRPSAPGRAGRQQRRSRGPGSSEVLDMVGLAERGRAAGRDVLARHGASGSASPRRCSATRRVLLLDEPVNGLDPEGIRWIRDLLRSLAAEGRTVFVSSHLIGEMALTAERLVVIGRGRLLADTTVAELSAGRRRWRTRSSG